MQELLESGLLVVVTILSVVLLLMGQKKSSGMTRKQTEPSAGPCHP